MKRLIALLALLVSVGVFAQDKSADAIILRNDASFTVTGKNKAVYKNTIEVFLTKKASYCADFSCVVNKGSTKLVSFSGEVTDATGKTTKVKKKDLVYTEYSEGLSDSFQTWMYSPDILQYPAKVTYTYEKQYTDAVLGYDSFLPLPFGDGVAVNEASYTLTVPSEDCFRYKQLNMPQVSPEHTSTKEGEVYVWKVKDLPPMKVEKYSPPQNERVPKVMFTPSEFSYEGNAGSGENWQSIGNWLYSLIEGRNVPTPEMSALVERLTEGAEDDMEKIRRLYAYLGQNTRYVSIQLGLGGLRPIAPESVFKNKFGDCKALTLFLQTLLKSCGIESYYTVINMGADRMMPDFPSLATANHVILSIPTAKDTLWVECTNPDVPLGYIHSEIAGNHALVVKKDGSYVTTLPKYPDSANRCDMKALVDLRADGSASVMVSECGRMDFWDSYYSLSRMNEVDKTNSILASNSLPKAELSDIKVELNSSAEPFGELSYSAAVTGYASVTGSRLFLTANPFQYFGDGRTPAKRFNDLYFRVGYDMDQSIEINVPEGYVVEVIPKGEDFENEFGAVHFECAQEQDGDSVKVKITLRYITKSGTFSKDIYSDYRALKKSIYEACSAKIVLVKK